MEGPQNRADTVPIATLAGVSTFTELLPELPLPSPMPSMESKGLLLYSPSMLDKAKKLVQGSDPNLVQNILQALSQITTSHIELKDEFCKEQEFPLQPAEFPPLLQDILLQAPDIFQRQGLEHFSPPQGTQAPYSPQAPLPAGHAVAGSPYYQHGSPIKMGMVQPPAQFVTPNSQYPPAQVPYPPHGHYSPQSVQAAAQMQLQHSPPPNQFPAQAMNAYNGVSPNMQPQVNNSHIQEFSPLKTRRMRQQPISHSAPGGHIQLNQIDLNQGAATSPQFTRNQPRPTSQTNAARRNLTQTLLTEPTLHNTQTSPLNSNLEVNIENSISALEKLVAAPRNGYKSPVRNLEVLEELSVLAESQIISDNFQNQTEQKQVENNDEQRTCEDPVIDEIINYQHVSESIRSPLAEEMVSKELIVDLSREKAELENDIRTLQLLSPKENGTVDFPNDIQIDNVQTPVMNMEETSVIQHTQKSSDNSTHHPGVVLASNELLIPKIIIKRTVQRRGSRDVEVHEIVSPQGKPAVSKSTKRKHVADGVAIRRLSLENDIEGVLDEIEVLASQEESTVSKSTKKKRIEDGVEIRRLTLENEIEEVLDEIEVLESVSKEKSAVSRSTKKKKVASNRQSSIEDKGTNEIENSIIEDKIAVLVSDPPQDKLALHKDAKKKKITDGTANSRLCAENEIVNKEGEHEVLEIVPPQRKSSLNKDVKRKKVTTDDRTNKKPSAVNAIESKAVEYDVLANVAPREKPAVSKSVKRKRVMDGTTNRGSSAENENINEIENMEEEIANIQVHEEPKRKKKEKRRRLLQPVQNIEEEGDILETPAFKRFGSALENVFEFDDSCDASKLIDLDEEEPPPETLVSKGWISDLCSEAAKLKAVGVLNKVPADQLRRLVLLLERHVRDGFHLILNSNNDDGEEESKLWRELCMDRIMSSVEAGLIALYITTARDMPKEVHVEEVIEKIVRLVKFQLQNNIYPDYDPVYRIDTKKDINAPVSKSKRSRASMSKVKPITALYNKLCEVVSLLSEVLEVDTLTDTIVLQISTMGTSPFFVENVSELQHSALKLVRTIFRKYVKHRELILEDIFASFARLPSTKKNLRNYRLHDDESIQMVTALVLQLIQCSAKLTADQPKHEENTEENQTTVDKDVVILSSYESSLRTAQNFLSTFLHKCSTSSKDEEDYRPLFENFLQDLLILLNRPAWPSAEVLLTFLGRLLVLTFSNKSNDMGLRVAAIDYLGVVAAHLRKDAVNSQQQDADDITAIVVDLCGEDSDEESNSIPSYLDEEPEKKAQLLQKGLLYYLSEEGKNDLAFEFARQFYLSQWLRDTHLEMNKSMKGSTANANNTLGEEEEESVLECQAAVEMVQVLEDRKKFLYGLIEENHSRRSMRASRSDLSNESSILVAKYLSASRVLSKSFDIYLKQIFRVLNENVIAIRTKAMKALSSIVAADPSILSREDMQKGVYVKFMDSSPSVREAAVELIGKFVLNRPELTLQYYDMIVERILDTGISVRKRVIKILKDICIEQPGFPKVSEICVKMIRRINDEEGIKELVSKVFLQMWFTLSSGNNHKDLLLKKVINITDVVSACSETGHEHFEQLLENMLKGEDDQPNKSVLEACRQIVNCLVENVLVLEEKAVAQSGGEGSTSRRLVSCLTTLYLFTKACPVLMIPHATTLQPYLSTKCNTQGDCLVLHNVSRILELVIPLMEHPNETFLASLEEGLMQLILKQGQTVVQGCISCLAAIINRVTHNIRLVKECFQKYFNYITKVKNDQQKSKGPLGNNKASILRALFTLGLLCKHFDFDEIKAQNQQGSVKERVYGLYIFFAQHSDEEVCSKAITGLGFLCMRYPKLLLKNEAQQLYQTILAPSNDSLKLKLQILKNLQSHLAEEEVQLRSADSEWKVKADKENLKDLGDMHSGMTSAVMQVTLKPVLENLCHSQAFIRMAALRVVDMVLRQGLLHPAQCIPYLIAASTDTEQSIRVKSEQLLSQIDSKSPGFVQMKSLAGIKLSFELLVALNKSSNDPGRGYRKTEGNSVTSCLSHLYTMVRSSRQNRRSLLQSLLRMFDDQTKTNLAMLLYIADNLAHFPYLTHEEPLFVIHHIDMMLSVAGANILQSYKEALLPTKQETSEDPEISVENVYNDDDETLESLLERVPSDLKGLINCFESSEGCMLLLLLKKHLKEFYGFSDSKCQKYSPSEPSKTYDKALQRKTEVTFDPSETIAYLKNTDNKHGVNELLTQYIEFKNLMMSLDPAEEDSDESNGRESPFVETQIIDGVEVITTKPKEKRPPKPKKIAKGRKTPPNPQGKGKAKRPAKKKKKKILCSDDEGLEDSGSDGEEFVL